MRHGRRLREILERFNDSGRLATRLGHRFAMFGDPTGGASGDDPTDAGKADAKKIIARFRGRAEDALASVVDENAELRRERRELRAKVPAEGSVVLSAADAASFNAYKALGTPEVLTKAVKDAADLAGQISARDKKESDEKLATDAAALAGFNPAILRELVVDKKLELSFREETVDSKTVRIPLVKVAGDANAQPTKLVDFAKASLAAYMPALTAKPEATRQGTPAPDGTPYPNQSSASDTGRAPGSPTGTKMPVGTRQYLSPSQRAAAGQPAAQPSK